MMLAPQLRLKWRWSQGQIHCLLLAISCLGFAACIGLPSLAAAEAGDPLDELLHPAPEVPAAPPRGDELLQFEEFPTVVSATRQATPANMTAIPVFVIDGREIHNSGATSLPEILQYAPGMDVLKADRNHTQIGIRGMFSYTNDRILGLVDGIKSSHPVTGYIDYQQYPLFLEDIQRVEIVRGPTGAAWGANAFFGVINILTKDPADTQGVLATASVDQFGDNWSQFRWGSHAGQTRWRISAGYINQVPSSVAVDRDFRHDDGNRAFVVDSKLVVEPSDHTKITFGMAYTHEERDSMEVLAYQPNNAENVDLVRTWARYEHTLGADASTVWTGSFNYNDECLPSFFSARSLEAGLEGQWNYQGLKDHDISLGCSFRYAYADQFHNRSQDFTFAGDPNTELWSGAYFVDRIQVASRLWLEAQARGDLFQFDQAGQRADWSARLSAIVAADEDQNHVFRLSGAKSYRAPTMFLRTTSFQRFLLPTPPFPPDSYVVNVAQGRHLETETIWSAEAGYSGRFGHGFDLQINGYYQRYLHLLSARLVNRVPPQEFYQIDNIDGAFGYGAALHLNYRVANFEIGAWYSYNGFRAETVNGVLRATPPSPDKVGARMEWQPAEKWVTTLYYRYNNLTSSDGGTGGAAFAARDFNQLDFSILRQFPAIHGELLFAISDIFNDTAIPARDITTFNSPHVTPGRRFIGRFQVEF